jgi:molybdopterin converting factor small subunit
MPRPSPFTCPRRCASIAAARPTSPSLPPRCALDALERAQPTLYRNLCDETGAVRRHLNVFVNTALLRDHGGLDAALAPGDVVTILAAVSGG